MEQEKETGLTVEEICQMMKTFDQSSLQSFLYQREGEKLKMSRRPGGAEEISGDTGHGAPFSGETGEKRKVGFLRRLTGQRGLHPRQGKKKFCSRRRMPA
jgi:hypothetical protein